MLSVRFTWTHNDRSTLVRSYTRKLGVLSHAIVQRSEPTKPRQTFHKPRRVASRLISGLYFSPFQDPQETTAPHHAICRKHCTRSLREGPSLSCALYVDTYPALLNLVAVAATTRYRGRSLSTVSEEKANQSSILLLYPI